MENLKRSRLAAGLDVLPQDDQERLDSDDSCGTDGGSSQGSRSDTAQPKSGKKTRGRVRINMEFIDNKLRRYTTFSKRKSGIMKKAHELATLTGTQVMLLVASETGHVYTFATRKLQPILSSEAGKQLIQTCLNSPDPNDTTSPSRQDDQRMSAQGFEEPELSYVPPDDTKDGLLQKTYHMLNAMSAQHERSPTPQHRQNPDLRTSSSTPLNYTTMNNAVDTSKANVHLPSSQSFALMPAHSASSHLEQQHYQLAASAGIRMQMVPVLHERSSSIPPPDVHDPHHSAIARANEDGRISFLNQYHNLQRPVAGVQPLLLATHGPVEMPETQDNISNLSNTKKSSR